MLKFFKQPQYRRQESKRKDYIKENYLKYSILMKDLKIHWYPTFIKNLH